MKKLIFGMLLVGAAPVCGMDGQQEAIEVVIQRPPQVHTFNSLNDLKSALNYRAVMAGDEFTINDDKGEFEVTEVTPYQENWLGSETQCKHFNRPRFCNKYF